MEIRNENMPFSTKNLLLPFVFLNCVVTVLSSVLIIILTRLNITSSGIMGFFELGIVILLPIAGIIAGFKIGNLYIFIYNTFAGLLNTQKVDLNNGL